MVPIFVNIQDKVNIDVDGRGISEIVTPDKVGITSTEEDSDITITEPFNHTAVQMNCEGLAAVIVIVSQHRVYVLGNYAIDKLSDLCCATFSGTTVCGRAARIRSGRTTVRC